MLFTTLFGCSKDNSMVEQSLPWSMEQSYLSSKSFSKIKASFEISDSDVKFDKSFNITSGSKDVDILIIPIYRGNVHEAYLWVYNNKKENRITTLYESLTYENSILSSASLYSESKLFIMDIDFEKEKTGLRYKIADDLDKRVVSKKLASKKLAETPPVDTEEETYVDCVTRVYQTAKQACEADPTCDTLCDFTPGCHTSMLAAAAYTCL